MHSCSANSSQGQRRVAIRERKTARDWASEIKQLVDHDYPNVEKLGSSVFIMLINLAKLKKM